MANSNWMTQDELCAEWCVSRPTLQRYRREGTGPAFYRLPAGVRYLRSDVEAWLALRRVAAYRRQGARGPKSTGYYLPGIIPGGELRAWLEERLGSLASLDVERVKARDSKTALATFERIGRDATDRISLPLARFRETLKTIDDFFAALSEDDDEERESEATPGTT